MGSKYAGTPQEVEALTLYILLSRCQMTIENAGNIMLQGSGLSLSQFGILETLFHSGSLTQNQLAEKHLSSRANISQIISRLENKKMVERTFSENDKRVAIVVLTETGKNLIQKILPELGPTVLKSISKLDTEERADLAKLLKKILCKKN